MRHVISINSRKYVLLRNNTCEHFFVNDMGKTRYSPYKFVRRSRRSRLKMPVISECDSRILRFHKRLSALGIELPLILPSDNVQSDYVCHLMENLLNKKYFDANTRNIFDESFLYWLCKSYSDIDLVFIIRLLCEHKADVNFCRDGHNSLMVLIKRKKELYEAERTLLAATTILVAYGLNVNHRDASGTDAISMLLDDMKNDFSVYTTVKIIKQFVENNYDINGTSHLGTWRSNAYLRLLSTKMPGISAVDSFILFELTRYLFEKGLDVNATDKLGFNALMLLTYDYVLQPGTIQMLHTFIEYGINLNHKNNEGRNVFNIICFNQKYPANCLLEFAKVLLRSGEVDVSNVDCYGEGNLIALIDRPDATELEVWTVIELLLLNGFTAPENNSNG